MHVAPGMQSSLEECCLAERHHWGSHANPVRSHFLGCVGLLGLVFLLPYRASAYVQSDLQGTWEFSSIASGPGAPWWERGHAVIAPDGSFSAQTSDNGGGTGTILGDFSLSSLGVITRGGQSTFRGALDIGTSVIAATDTWSGVGAGTTELRIGLKQALTYALADLVGTWELNVIASGPGAPWWERGRMTVAADGSVSGTLEDSDGQLDPISGTLGISPAGVITIPGSTTARGVLDAHKSVMAITSTWTGFAAGTVDLSVGVKMAATYSLADLAGTWEVHSLATGPGAPQWTRTHLTIAADGSYSGSFSENNGGAGTSSGTLSMTPAGVITRSGASTARGVLASGKSVMVWTNTWSTGSPGTTEFEVAINTSTGTTDVPTESGLGLRIEPVRPNPIRAGDLTVHFVLPSDAPASLELLDVGGRRLAGCDLGAFGAGRHAQDLGANRRLAPGLYLVRLRQGASTRMAKVVVRE